MRRTTRNRRGAITIVLLGVAFAMMLFTAFFLEANSIWNAQHSIDARAQRAINSTVEYSMDDRYRSDGYNFMNVSVARDVIDDYLEESLMLDGVSGRKHTHTDGYGKGVYAVEYTSILFYDGNGKCYNSSGEVVKSGLKGVGAGIVLEMDVTLYTKIALAFDSSLGSLTWKTRISSTNFRIDDDQRAGDSRYDF